MQEMAEYLIKTLEEVLSQRASVLLKKVTRFALESFEKGPEYFQKSTSEGQPVGMFVLKRREGVNQTAMRSDLRVRPTVPLDSDGLLVIDDRIIPWCNLRTFLTPTSIGGPQIQVHEWNVSRDGVSGGVSLMETEDLIGLDVPDTIGLETAFGNSDHQELRGDGTPIDGLLREAVRAELKAQQKTAEYLNNLIARYMTLTNFSDIY